MTQEVQEVQEVQEAQDLVSFLSQTPVTELEYEITIPGRLSKFKFKVKPMDGKQHSRYQQLSTTTMPGRNRNVKFNNGKFNELVLVNNVVYPNFKDASLLASKGVNTPEEYINKFLLAGEIDALVNEICKLSGFTVTDTELEEEVKNS